MASPKATAVLDLDIESFDKAISTAKKLMAGLAAAFASYKTFDFFKDGVKDAITFAKETQSASRAMGGFDPGALLLSQKALEKAGIGAEEARGHVADFIREGRNIKEIFGGSENYAKALKSAAQDYGSQASVLTRTAEKLQSVWNTLESIGSKVRTFFLTMTEQFVLPLQAALDYINEIDLSGIGKSFGNSISKAATTMMGIFKNGDTIEALKSGLVWAFQAGVDALITGLHKAVAFFSASMEAIQKSFKESFFAADMLIVMKNIFKGLGEIISSSILSATAKLAETIGASGTSKELESASNREMIGSQNHFRAVSNIIADTDFLKAGFDTAKAIQKGMDASSKIQFGETESGLKAKATWETMRDMIGRGFETGIKMEEESRRKHAGDENLSRKVLTSFSGSSSKVIADNLAKVGGGGNYLRAGMSLQERTQLEQLRAQKQGNQTLEIISRNTGSKPKPAAMGR